MQNGIIIDQTRPDHYSVLKSVKKFLKKLGIRKVHYRLVFWSLEYVFFRLFRRRKKICILRPKWAGMGLFCYFNNVLAGIVYAKRRNMIPVVDMRTLPNTYLYDDEVGRVNSWEYYFAQPDGIQLDEALRLEDAVITKIPFPDMEMWPQVYAEFFLDYCWQLTFWRKICRKYIHFVPAVHERFRRMKEKHDGKKILGVLVRGTDYIATKPSGHPIPPTAEQAIAKAQEAMKGSNFDAVYLATEDKKIVAKFHEAFEDKLILPEADYVDYDYDNPVLLYKYNAGRSNDKYLRGLEYLVSMLFLSKCAGFITSGTSGSAGVMCLSEGFEYLYFFDLGVYP